MNRLRSILLLIVTLLFIGCQESKRVVVIGVSQSIADDWHNQVGTELLSEAIYFEGFNVDIKCAEGDTAKQIEQIEQFIDKRVDAIVITPNDSKALVPIIEQAHKQNIPTIIVDRPVETELYTAFVGTDNFKLGQLIGSNISRLTPAKRILEICNVDDEMLSQLRHDGVVDKLRKSIEHLGVYYVVSDTLSVERCVDSLLQATPSIDLILGHSDMIAHAAHNSAKRAGRDEDIQFWGIGALSVAGGGIELVNEGILDVTYIYATGAYQIITTINKILSDREYRRATSLNSPMVDLSRAKILRYQSRAELNKLNGRVNSLHGYLSNYIQLSNMRLYMLLAAFVALLICAGVALFIYKKLRSKIKTNEQLERQYRELEEVVKTMEQIEAQSDVEAEGTAGSSEHVTTPLESKFLAKFNEIVEQNIGNVDFEFENIGDELCYSRVHVYRKVKALTGESPSRLLRKARLERADKLLRTTDRTVAEIAFEVGFSAPSYFSRSYKEHFGVLPSAIKR